ncbi:hypothetical protein TNCV_4166721 [Trichonephila clavipes]|nr:hypothetical protein TNCV_4166721 [Trichonephila clavipes]
MHRISSFLRGFVEHFAFLFENLNINKNPRPTVHLKSGTQGSKISSLCLISVKKSLLIARKDVWLSTKMPAETITPPPKIDYKTESRNICKKKVLQ